MLHGSSLLSSRSFILEGEQNTAVRETSRCVSKPPLAYRFAFAISLHTFNVLNGRAHKWCELCALWPLMATNSSPTLELPADLRHPKSIASLKSRLKTCLLIQTFGNVCELLPFLFLFAFMNFIVFILCSYPFSIISSALALTLFHKGVDNFLR